jgi:hypothetical protein
MRTFDLVQLLESASTPEKFWALMILIAVADEATRLSYDATRSQRILRMEVAGTEHEAVPPPANIGPKLSQAIQQMIGHGSQSSIWSALGATRATRLEGAFGVRIGKREIRVDASIDSTTHRVDLRFTPITVALAEVQPLLATIREKAEVIAGKVLREAYEEEEGFLCKLGHWIRW